MHNLEKKKRNLALFIVVIGVSTLVITGVIIGQDLIKEKETMVTTFKDLPNSHWAYDTVVWAIDQGISTGYADGTFQPQKPVTEAEFLAMIFRTFEDESEAKKDAVAIGDWANRYYFKALEKNWNVWGRASRNQVISRVDMAIIVTSALGYNLTEDGAIQTILDLGITQGKKSATIDGFGFGDLTRVGALETIKNLVELGVIELKERPSELSPQPELDSTFIQFVTPIEELTEAMGYSIQSVAWSRESMIRLGEHGIAYLSYRSKNSPYNQLVLYAAEEKRHLELVREIVMKIGIPIDPDFDRVITQVISERKSVAKEYGKWEVVVTPGNLEGYVQISFWKVE